MTANVRRARQRPGSTQSSLTQTKRPPGLPGRFSCAHVASPVQRETHDE